MRKIIPAILTIFIIGVLWQPTSAQAGIKTIRISSLDYSAFPQIVTTVRVLDENGRPVRSIAKVDLFVREDSNEVDFDLQEVYVGVNTVLVIDINNSFRPDAIEEIKQIAFRYIESMGKKDQLAIITVRREQQRIENGVAVYQEFTGDQGSLTNSVNNLTYGNPIAGISEPLLGMELAMDMLAVDPGSQRVNTVVLISPGTSKSIHDPGERVDALLDKAADLERIIPIFTIQLGGEDNAHMRNLGAGSGGLYAAFSGQASLDRLFELIEQNRRQMQISLRSTSASAGERILAIGVSGAPAPLVAHPFVVAPPPLAPEIVSVVINQGDPILRQAPAYTENLADIPPTEVVVTATYQWPDGYDRDLFSAELWVDGQFNGEALIDPAGELRFTWEVRKFKTPGTTTANIEVRIKDELGLQNAIQVNVPVQVINPKPEIAAAAEPAAPCGWFGDSPGIGDVLGETCTNLGITTTKIFTFIFLIGLLIFTVVLWLSRGAVVRAGSGIALWMTDLYRRLSGGRAVQQAKLRLEVINGWQQGDRQVFDLFGETPIGRDRAYSELVFVDHPHISRVHCIIHEDVAHGIWTIEDRESANGTFLNGDRLQPFAHYPLNDGDLIEIAQVGRGGIRFRLHIIIQAGAEQTGPKMLAGRRGKQRSQGGYSSSPNWQNADVSQTQPLTDGVSKGNPLQTTGHAPRSANREDNFDPSQQTF